MQTAQNILVATDFSVLSRGVAAHALELAQLLDAKLNVVTVHKHVGAVAPVNWQTRELQAQMAALQAEWQPSGRLVHAIIRFGEPAEGILRAAQELGADLIVMGTNSHHGFGRFTMGSTAQAVLRQASLPVLVVKKAALRPPAAAVSPAAS